MAQRRRPASNNSDEITVVIKALLRTLWIFKLELFVLTVSACSWYALYIKIGPIGASVVATAPHLLVLALCFKYSRLRKIVCHPFRVAKLRRQWRRAGRKIGIDRPPRLGRVTQWPVGDKTHISLTSECTASVLEKNAEKLAADMKLADVRIKRGKTQDQAELILVRRDPFDDLIVGPQGKDVIRALPWPDRHAEQLSMWDSIRIGVDHDGNTVTMSLIASNVLIAGVPGSGKSVAQSLVVAQAALDPHAHLWLMDGKDVDLPVWEKCAHNYTGFDRKQAIEMLKELRDETERRFTDLKAMSLETGRPIRKVSREMNLPTHVLVCDELASYLLADDSKGQTQATTILELLRQIASKGRAGNIIECLATQRPDSKTVDTKLRSLLVYRWAMKCTDYQSSDMITGGLASAGYDASDIPDAQKGVGWVCAEGDKPILTRGFNLDDDDIYEIAQRATTLSKGGSAGVAPEPERVQLHVVS